MADGQGGILSSFKLWQATLLPVLQLPGVIVVYLAALALALGGATSNTSLVAKLLVLTPE